jgi:hypothetical protein
MVFLTDALTHWAWIIPVIILVLLEFIFLPINNYTYLAIFAWFISFLLFIIGKLNYALGPKLSSGDIVKPIIPHEYTQSHQNYYIVFITFIILSFLLSVASKYVGNKLVPK